MKTTRRIKRWWINGRQINLAPVWRIVETALGVALGLAIFVVLVNKGLV